MNNINDLILKKININYFNILYLKNKNILYSTTYIIFSNTYRFSAYYDLNLDCPFFYIKELYYE